MKTQRPPLKWRPQSRAFTLIELLVVIAIIAILAALTMGTFAYAQQAASRNRTTAGLSSIVSALEQYKEKFGEYPEPANPSTMGTSGSAPMRIGGALMLYQAITGDGNSEIKLATGVSPSTPDGKIDDTEQPNVINADYIPLKDAGGQWKSSKLGSTLVTSDGFMLVDGFGHPYQYDKGGTTDAVNTTFDVWSFAQLESGRMAYDIDTKKNDTLTAVWIKNW